MSATFKQKAIYESVFGKIPKNYHIHRIVPGYKGGRYTIGNMIALYIDDHVLIHKLRYERLGDPRDILASSLLKEKRSMTSYERSSLGGRVSGIFKDSDFQSEQGKKGGKIGIGSHINKVAYSKSRSAGGKVSAAKFASLGAGSFSIKTCIYCGKEARIVDLGRWHKDARCVKDRQVLTKPVELLR